MGGLALSREQTEELWNVNHEEGAQRLANTISSMKGFYVKAAQIMSTRGDLFPKQYIDALNQFTDNLDPMPVAMVKAIIVQELLQNGQKFEEVFVEFDKTPLGAASIAQVHRGVLSEKYGSREVAVKIQRPSIESKLMGDIANLKLIAKLVRDADAFPVDYYTIFSELEVKLKDEFDFLEEAKAMASIYDSLAVSLDGSTETEVPILIPKPVAGLVTERVLVMDFLEGNTLSRANDEMERRGIKQGSGEAKLFGKKIVKALTAVFGRNILETGLFHADPHPGNILITEQGEVGLIDFGQVKQLSKSYRQTIAKIVIALTEHDDSPAYYQTMGSLIAELGVELKADAKPEAAAAIAIWLFDGSVDKLPGGYDMGELSPNAPVKEIEVFPQDLVLVARSAMLIKAFSRRFGIRWSLANEWAPVAREVLFGPDASKNSPSRFRKIRLGVKKRGTAYAKRALNRMPPRVRSRLASLIANLEN